MIRLLLTFAALFSMASAYAQDASTSSMKADKPEQNATKGEDVDEIITNAKMRAETGSKSKYSVASAFSYSGGPLASPGNEHRPNLSAATGTTDIASMGGSVSAKYGINSQNALFAGVGMRWLAPMEKGLPSDYNGSKFDVDNPYLNYQYVYRWLGVQAAATLNETFYTNTNLVHAGYVTQWSISQNNMYDIARTHISVGINVYADLGYFDKNDMGTKHYQSDYSFGATPAIEYHLSDKWNLRTDANPWSFQHIRDVRNSSTFGQQHWGQTFSVGYALMRDVYISPGIQWLPEHISADRTVTWLNANINIF